MDGKCNQACQHRRGCQFSHGVVLYFNAEGAGFSRRMEFRRGNGDTGYKNSLLFCNSFQGNTATPSNVRHCCDTGRTISLYHLSAHHFIFRRPIPPVKSYEENFDYFPNPDNSGCMHCRIFRMCQFNHISQNNGQAQ